MVPFGLASVQLATALLSNPQGPQGIFASESGAMYDFVEIDKAVFRFPKRIQAASYGLNGDMYLTETCVRGEGDQQQQCQMYDWKDKDDAESCRCRITGEQRVEVFAHNASLQKGATCFFNDTVCFVKTNESELEIENRQVHKEPKRQVEKRENYFDIKMLAPNCSQVRGGVQFLRMLMNSTGRRFDCVDMARLKVDSHMALDDEIYKGFGDSPARTSKVQGVVHGFDFKDTAGGDALRLTLMHNVSGVTDEVFGVQVHWRPWQTRVLTTLNQVLRGFLAESHNKPALESQLLLGLKSYPQVKKSPSESLHRALRRFGLA